MANDNPSGHKQPKMLIDLPVYLLYPIRVFGLLLANRFPGAIVSLFGFLANNIPRNPLNSSEEAFLKSGQLMDLFCDNIVLQGYSFGNGPTVLLVHGNLANAAHYRSIIPKLVDSGYRVVAYDAINCGGSPDGVFLSSDSISQLNSIIRQLGDIHTIIAHSAGCYFSYAALLNFPLTSTLKKCIYISAHPDTKGNMLMVLDYFRVPKKVHSKIFTLYEEMMGVSFEEQSVGKVLPKHRVSPKPTNLFIHDTDDEYIPFYRAQEFIAADPKAELFVTKGLGHFKILRDKRVIDKIMKFIASE